MRRNRNADFAAFGYDIVVAHAAVRFWIFLESERRGVPLAEQFRQHVGWLPADHE